MSEHGPRILVVDDEQAIRRYLRTSLGTHGYVVYEATTGQEALAAVVSERPDLVILDLGLPDIDGVEVVRRLREWTQLPVLVLSIREREADKIAQKTRDKELAERVQMTRSLLDAPPALVNLLLSGLGERMAAGELFPDFLDEFDEYDDEEYADDDGFFDFFRP